MIYQPVLRWGNNGEFGGSHWVVASWYADGQNGLAFHSPPVQVDVGQRLVGIMTLTSQSGSKFSYHCQFQGIAKTSLDIADQPELTWLVETLEAYKVTRCSNYPSADSTIFYEIEVETGNTKPNLDWTEKDVVTDCGQKTIVVSNNNGNGQV
jgi:hypothetical protein